MVQMQFEKLGGGPLTLGKPALVVNTASACGYTPQYAALQKLWETYRDRGLIVLGVPCNDFGAQEPGSPQEIASFCATNYSVSFPLAAKASVTSQPRHPFYESVAQELGDDGLPRWNFHKYLVAADGELIGSWPSKVSPLSKEITDAIEGAL